ncbi:MAG: Tat (Twin-arginine translocation) pathway signal sequence domain protein [uncultured Thiotrichaceae bacterium]|uniref:Tat (Twin-arginine translocation) pathway signal sequence domain protein n=1 Tax=uncultured Thiotrichaceae bacterium TaxID=298394 RepID=A0A6S6TJU9_9GAMM|nr:MAG: Tat (Twin-arginine translocation) pathway signal sequence domain protein [uncultured Thiotrichaceae bacterium]
MSRLRAVNQASAKKPNQHVFENSQTRREFLTRSAMAGVLTGLLMYKPVIAKVLDEKATVKAIVFSKEQQLIIEAVQQQLFPDDGDGPSASDLQAYRYLQWALEDKKNIEDGDPVFIQKGVAWLEAQADEQFSQTFIKLSSSQQHQVLAEFSKTQRGENWMSLLVYYLLEALTLDPVYGGNPEQIGWKWLEHQPGYPRPPVTKLYRYYQGLS